MTTLGAAIDNLSLYIVASWATSPQPELDDRTPADWIATGDADEPVVLAAQRAARTTQSNVTASDDRFVRVLDAGTELHRIHGLRPGTAAFFDSSPHGRFNLTDAPGQGTCYLALDALGAYVETLGRVLIRSVSDIARRRHNVITIDRNLCLFDLTRSEARSAYRHENLDLTATIGAGDDYGTPQRLAALTYRDGYDGILYRARHDPGHRHDSIALFGRADPNETDTVIVAAATRTFGIVVLPDHPE